MLASYHVATASRAHTKLAGDDDDDDQDHAGSRDVSVSRGSERASVSVSSALSTPAAAEYSELDADSLQDAARDTPQDQGDISSHAQEDSTGEAATIHRAALPASGAVKSSLSGAATSSSASNEPANAVQSDLEESYARQQMRRHSVLAMAAASAARRRSFGTGKVTKQVSQQPQDSHASDVESDLSDSDGELKGKKGAIGAAELRKDYHQDISLWSMSLFNLYFLLVLFLQILLPSFAAIVVGLAMVLFIVGRQGDQAPPTGIPRKDTVDT